MIGDEITDEGVTYVVVFDGRQPLVPDRQTLALVVDTKAERKNLRTHYQRRGRTGRTKGPARFKNLARSGTDSRGERWKREQPFHPRCALR